MADTTTPNNIDNSGVVANEATLKGKYVAGRDIILTENNITHLRLRFTEIDLHPYSSDNYISPQFTPQLLQEIKSTRLLTIGGSYEFDKNSFVRHLAYLLYKNDNTLKIKEWADRSDRYSVFSTLIEEKEPTIFIFSQISPQDVGYNLEKFSKLAQEHNHYIVMSSDLPVVAWKLSEIAERSFWFEIPTDNIYDRTVLTQVLIEEILEHQDAIDLDFTIHSFANQASFTTKLSFTDVATQLKTIDKIKIFVRLLANEKKSYSETGIEHLLYKITKDNKDLINQWFNTLNSKEKETVLALSMLDGLYDDQFFSAVEFIVSQSWRRRKSDLDSLDYFDLDTLLNFFNVEEIEGDKRLIRGKFPNQRIDFFRSIWHSHRRHLLSALPVLVKLIENSVTQSHLNWELFGTEERRDRLQDVISDALSDIGIIHFPAVENTFIRLASSRNIRVQEITAKSLARWREYGKEEQLFEVLKRWQEESRITELIEELWRLNKSKNEISSEAYIRSTIALTLGYASQYDKPNELSKKLIKIFKEFAKDDNELIRMRFRQLMLPQFTQNHLGQLKDYLFELTKQTDLIHPIALGIANAYNDYPDQVQQTIEEWLAYCSKNTKYRTKGFFHKLSKRDKVLITVVLALSEIEYIEEYEFNATAAYNMIISLQKTEYHRAVWKWYLHFIKRQIDIHSANIQPEIVPVIENLSFDDRPDLINHFVEIYFNQRYDLTDADDSIYFNDHILPIWTKGERPLTEIEKTMINWMSNENGTGQQIAMETLYEFTRILEVAEKKYIIELKEARKKEKEEEKKSYTEEIKDKRISRVKPNLTSKMISFFTLSNYDNESKSIIQNLIPVLVKNNYNGIDNLDIISKKMRREGDNNLKDVSRYVNNFSSIMSNYSTALVASLFIIIALVVAFFAMIS